MDNHNKLRLAGVIKNNVFIGPEKVLFHITNICNLNCIFCWYHSPYQKDPKLINPRREELNYKAFKETIDDCSKLKVKWIQLSSQGETTLHSKITDMITYVKNKGFLLSILSNGSFNKSILGHIAKADELIIDLSAPDNTLYQSIHRPKSADIFHNIIKNLSFLSKLKRSGKKAPYIYIKYILNSKNYKELPDMFKLAYRYNIDYLNITPLDPAEHTRQIRISKRNLSALIDKIKKEDLFLKVKNNIYVSYLENKVFSIPEIPKVEHCYNGWYYALININGDVTPCCKIKSSLIAGNIYNSSFKKIWHSKIFNGIRRQGKYSLYDKRFRVCSNCCFHRLNKKIHDKVNNAFMISRTGSIKNRSFLKKRIEKPDKKSFRRK